MHGLHVEAFWKWCLRPKQTWGNMRIAVEAHRNGSKSDEEVSPWTKARTAIHEFHNLQLHVLPLTFNFNLSKTVLRRNSYILYSGIRFFCPSGIESVAMLDTPALSRGTFFRRSLFSFMQHFLPCSVSKMTRLTEHIIQNWWTQPGSRYVVCRVCLSFYLPDLWGLLSFKTCKSIIILVG